MKRFILIVWLALSSATLIAQTSLKKGDAAPSFTAMDNSGKELNLKALLKSHKAVVLFFTVASGARIAINKSSTCRIHCSY